MTMQYRVDLGSFIRDIAKRFDEAGLFYGHGTDNAWDEAVYLVFSLLKIPFDSDPSVMARLPGEEETARVELFVQRRIEQRLPVAYLLREAWFAGRSYRVDERVLIPRSPIAELILNDFEPLLAGPPGRILDLCTGSGCIGIACAHQFPDARVELSDLSPQALEVAEENIRRHEVGDRVKICQSDLFESLEGRYDLIVSNPPYVPADEVEALPPEYAVEPELALLSEDQGLALPLRILREAGDYLEPKGLLIMEVGYSRPALEERLPDVPLLWLEFEHGGEGVFALSGAQLRSFRHRFQAANVPGRRYNP